MLVFNNRTFQTGVWTLRAGGTFTDNQGRSGAWTYNPVNNHRLTLAYPPGVVCNAIQVGNAFGPGAFQGRAHCRDGTVVSGFWLASQHTGQVQ